MSASGDDHVDVGDEVPVVEFSETAFDLSSEAVTHVDHVAEVTEAHFEIPPTPGEQIQAILRIVESMAASVAELDERTKKIDHRIETLSRSTSLASTGETLINIVSRIDARVRRLTD